MGGEGDAFARGGGPRAKGLREPGTDGVQPAEVEETRRGAGGAGLLDGIADPVRLGLVRRLVEVGEATAGELSDSCQASRPTVRRHLEALVAWGIVGEAAGASDGETPGRPAARFSLTAQARQSARGLLGP